MLRCWLRWLVLAAVLPGCGDRAVTESIILAESRTVEPGLLRLYYESDFEPDLERVDLRFLGQDRVAVQVREFAGGDGPALAVVHCVDVTTSRSMARRRLVASDGSRLGPFALTERDQASVRRQRGCPRIKGNLVEEFEPTTEGYG